MHPAPCGSRELRAKQDNIRGPKQSKTTLLSMIARLAARGMSRAMRSLEGIEMFVRHVTNAGRNTVSVSNSQCLHNLETECYDPIVLHVMLFLMIQ